MTFVKKAAAGTVALGRGQEAVEFKYDGAVVELDPHVAGQVLAAGHDLTEVKDAAGTPYVAATSVSTFDEVARPGMARELQDGDSWIEQTGTRRFGDQVGANSPHLDGGPSAIEDTSEQRRHLAERVQNTPPQGVDSVTGFVAGADVPPAVTGHQDGPTPVTLSGDALIGTVHHEGQVAVRAPLGPDVPRQNVPPAGRGFDTVVTTPIIAADAEGKPVTGGATGIEQRDVVAKPVWGGEQADEPGIPEPVAVDDSRDSQGAVVVDGDVETTDTAVEKPAVVKDGTARRTRSRATRES